MVGRALNSRAYGSRPPANVPTARAAWDSFIETEAKPRRTERYGNMGSAGVATTGPEEPAQNRTPKQMCRTFVGEWVWVMEFTNGDFDERQCSVISWRVKRDKRQRLEAAI
mgnify:CR=1 FL=1|jgi:hypothetical protein